jgi:hypothetical protein
MHMLFAICAILCLATAASLSVLLDLMDVGDPNSCVMQGDNRNRHQEVVRDAG